jgi:hypothetical protein
MGLVKELGDVASVLARVPGWLTYGLAKDETGPQLVGFGDADQDAKDDIMDQRLEREAHRDCQRAIDNAKVVGSMLN